MTAASPHHVLPSELLVDEIADALHERGYLILPKLLPQMVTDALRRRVGELGGGDFKRAGVGRNDQLQLKDDYRRDEIHWLDGSDPAEAAYLAWMEGLRMGLNRQLFLGLFDYECHFAHYPPGAFYKRHLDAFKGGGNRTVTVVLYLNQAWDEAWGGELLIYQDEQAEQPFQRVGPHYGRAVIFLSDRFPHEVVAASRDRYSIAGWFRINSSQRAVVDPPC